ncbi:hypothetical protein BC940DRAFT_306141 [Gongronella butleri]|nr:hypothetical protein BC940DRAFT_306141 [Gongronella butleri]
MPLNALKPALGCLDNQTHLHGSKRARDDEAVDQDPQRLFKQIRPAGQTVVKEEEVQKENRPPTLSFTPVKTPVSSSSSPPQPHPTTTSPHRFVSQTFATGNSGDCTRTRPTTGGKSLKSSPSPQRHAFSSSHHSQRLSPEQLKMLSRRIDPSLPMSPRGSPAKPALPQMFRTNHEKSQKQKASASPASSLYQTCVDLWPSEPTLGDFSSDNIKNLTDLLKVRLSQAKYRLLSQLEDNHASLTKNSNTQNGANGSASSSNSNSTSNQMARARRLLNDDIDYSTWPTFEKHQIDLPVKRSHSFLTVVGNAKHLYRHRHAYLERHQQKRRIESQRAKLRLKITIEQQRLHKPAVSYPPPLPGQYYKKEAAAHHAAAANAKRKRHLHQPYPPLLPPQHLNAPSGKKTTKRGIAIDMVEGRQLAGMANPQQMEDGTQIFTCEPCNKTYKTRNGLAYHLARCPTRPGAVLADPQGKHGKKPTSPSKHASNSSTMAPLSPSSSSKKQEKDDEHASSVPGTPSASSASSSSTVRCICDQPTNDEGMMLQCDKCQLWLHLDCVDANNEAALEDVYHCPRCIESAANDANVAVLSETLGMEPSSLDDLTAAVAAAAATSSAAATTTQDAHASSLDATTLLLAPTMDPDATLTSITSASTTSNTTAAPLHPQQAAQRGQPQPLIWDHAHPWPMSSTTGADMPSLLYSDATGLTSALDDDLHYMMDVPSSELSTQDVPPADWFQFANFDDDFHCDDDVKQLPEEHTSLTPRQQPS